RLDRGIQSSEAEWCQDVPLSPGKWTWIPRSSRGMTVTVRLPLLIGLTSFLASPAHAHLFAASGGQFSWLSMDPLALGLLALTAWLYHRGTVRTPPAADPTPARRRRQCFWAGWGALLLVLGTPLDA